MPVLNIAGYQIAPHVSQLRRYNPNASYRLQSMGCTPTSGANGINTVTGRRLSGDDVLRKVSVNEETIPGGGWSLNDLDLACARLGVGFVIRSGQGLSAVISSLNAGLAVVGQGDSEEFGNNTCSGAFNGDHCITIYPARKLFYGVWHRWIADPICPAGRWERESELWAYLRNLSYSIRFGVFTKPVAKVPPPPTGEITHRALFAAGAEVKVYSVDANGRIRGPWADGHYYKLDVWDNPASSAPCTAPIRRRTADGKSSALTVTIRKGYYAGKVIAANSDGVTIKEV